MLKKLQNASETWVSRILLFIIGASFIFWGISGQNMAGSDVALKIAGKNVSSVELEDEFKRQIAQMQSAMGGNINFNYKQAVQMGLLDQVINNMIYRFLLDAEAKNQGIYVTDEKIYEIIQNTKEFQDEKGNFSPEKFAYILEANNVSEKTFVDEIANSIAREILVNAIVSNIDPTGIAEILYKQKNEERIIDVVSFKVANEKITSTSKDEELKELYQLNISKFSQPEYRKISYIIISANDASKYKNIKSDDTDKIYKTMVEIGENIIDEINGGANITETAKTFNVKKVDLPDLNVDGLKRDGKLFKDSIFTQKYRDIAFFALDENGISDVLDNGDNVMLIFVEKVFEPRPKAFETVKSELSKMWYENMKISQASIKVNEILANLNKGEKFSTAVINVDKSANTSLNTKTGRFNNSFDANFLTKVFSEDLNKPFITKSPDVYYVAVVRGVILPSITEKDKAEFEKFKTSEQKNISENIFDDYMSYLYNKYGVKRNDKIISRYYQ
ncbi:MAG: peptidylprolyl isomerase [Alphaproteobacteria bacterium]